MRHKIQLIIVVILVMFGSGVVGYLIAQDKYEPAIITQINLPEGNSGAWYSGSYNGTQVIYDDVTELEAKIAELENRPLEILTVTEPVIQYVTKEVEVPIEKIVYQNTYSRQWESTEQFIDWYHAQEFTLLMPSSIMTVDCDDYADWVQTTALEQGYSVSVAIVWYGKIYNGKLVSSTFTNEYPGHAGCMVDIAGAYYFFEPEVNKFNGLIKIADKD